jgi:uncharacterized protein
MTDGYEERLQALVGRDLAPSRFGQDPVNVPMIRHWVEAMGDDNPIYLDDEAARATGREGVVAPPGMMQAWTMRGYAATVSPSDPSDTEREMDALLQEGGYTSVVATDSEFEFLHEVRPGDHLSATETIEAISPGKRTALGEGRFVTSVRTYRDQDGRTVATQRWRLLRFRPPASDGSTGTGEVDSEAAEAPPARRPRPAINRDNAFWFDAARERRLVIQRCRDCGDLRHPPGPTCPSCLSLDWDTVEASGRGHVHSYVVAHHPRIPGFTYPHVVALVELEEGVRLLADVLDLAPDEVEIDLPVELDWLQPDDELTLPAFRPTAPGGGGAASGGNEGAERASRGTRGGGVASGGNEGAERASRGTRGGGN